MSSRFVLCLMLGALIFGCAHDTTDTISEGVTDFGREGDGIVLNLSDLHFDPFYDAAIVPDLLSSAPGKWRNIFEHSKIIGYGEYGHDSNFPLLLSALRHAGQMARRADFVVISGDFLSHRFNETYYRYAGNKDPKGLNEFIDKTTSFSPDSSWNTFPTHPYTPHWVTRIPTAETIVSSQTDPSFTILPTSGRNSSVTARTSMPC